MILQHADAIRLAGQRDVEAADHQLEQARKQRGIVDIGAVRGVAVAARARVHADARRSAAENRESARLLRSMKRWSSSPDGIDLDREPALGEVDLHAVRALPQAGANFGLVLAQQIGDELLAGVAGNRLRRVHQAQGRRGDHRLLDRPLRVPKGHVEIAVGVASGSGTARRSAGACAGCGPPRTGS